MTLSTHTLSQPGAQPAFGDRLRHSKALIPTLAVLAVTVLALGAALVVSHSRAENAAASGYALQSPPVVAPAAVAPPAVAAAPAPAPVIVAPAALPAPAPVARATPRAAPSPTYREPVTMARAPVCIHCGTVESVTPVTRQGQVNGIGNTGIGVGAIGGAVVGGLIGNQIGHGKGKTAATVLGAAGGGFAGNAIEKNVRKTTVYEVRVRMNDGSYRTVEQSSPIEAGAPVIVEGGRLRPQTSAS